MSFRKVALCKWKMLKLLCKICCTHLHIHRLQVKLEVHHDTAQKTTENAYSNNYNVFGKLV